jgi:enamine deaminase RidA (YjgF/YER057c/UK114 family)
MPYQPQEVWTSQMFMYGSALSLRGQIADNTEGTTAEQVHDVLDKIERFLIEAGSDKSKILAMHVYLADMNDFAIMNEIWYAWIDPHPHPTRTTVEAKLDPPNLRVEMTVIAGR